MNVREWALILFTILSQMSVGAFIGYNITHLVISRKAGADQADRFSDLAMYAIWPVMGLAFLASLLHLGNPLNAYRSVTNLTTSWLSREILCGILFAVLGFGFALLQWRKIGSTTMRNALAWIASVFGILLVFSMSKIYMLPTQPSWDSIATPISFFTTTLLLGLLTLGAAFAANYGYMKRKDPGCREAHCELLSMSLRWIAIASILLLGVHLVVTPLYVTSLSTSGSDVALSSVELMIGEYGLVFALRLILVFIGAGVFGVFLYKNAFDPSSESAMTSFVISAFVLVFIAEILGRFIFYATEMQIIL